MNFIQLLTDETDVIYLNIDQILYVSPIGETSKTQIKLISEKFIIVNEPLYKVLGKIRQAEQSNKTRTIFKYD